MNVQSAHSFYGILVSRPVRVATQAYEGHSMHRAKVPVKRRPSRFRPQIERSLLLEQLEVRRLLTANGADTRHLRLAVSATEEYTEFFGGRAAAQNAIETTVAAVNKVFNRELNLQLDLIDNLDLVFGEGNVPDPFPLSAGPAFEANQTLLDSTLGSTGYDLGIVFGGIPEGLAFLGGAGIDAHKAKAFTGFTPAEGGPAGANAIDNALHELGHLLGAAHTVNGVLGICGIGRVAGSAFSPGSGSTLMDLTGTCNSGPSEPSDDLQGNSDFYFHTHSLEQLATHLESLDAAGVGTKDLAVNRIPTADAGPDYTIPASTPFHVSLSGTDADDPSGRSLQYAIEQLDLGPAQTLDPFSGDDGSGPLFRSFRPESSPDGRFVRTFPQLSDILGETTTIGEFLPTTTRTVTLRGTVRDGVGGVNTDDATLSVVDTGAPFAVTSFNSGGSFAGASTNTVTWDVAGTTANGINTSLVNIRLSTDGGRTFPHLLAQTANDGTHTVSLPNLETTAGRIKVEAEGNIFFDISDANFTIARDAAVTGVTVSDSELRVGESGSFSPATATYTLSLNTTPVSPVEITVMADSQTEVSMDGTSFASSVSLTQADTASREITVRAVSDNDSEGVQLSRITHSISSSSDVNYSTSLVIDEVVVEVADDQQAPLIGVDFQPAGLATPRNWTELGPGDLPTFAPSTFEDLIREDGISTDVDLRIRPTLGTSVSGTADVPGELTIPRHGPQLTDVGGGVYFDQFFAPGLSSVALNATWSGLDAGSRYNVYVLGLEGFGTSFTGDFWFLNQRVTITGEGSDDPDPFVMNSTARQRQLLINDMEGDDTVPLESYAKTVTADASGEINIEIIRDDGVDVNRVIVSGLAIQELPPPAFDFGDAPDDATAPEYETLLANDGPRHVIGSLFLGQTVDREEDGQPDMDAGSGGIGGDDGDALGDDEDGVTTIVNPVSTSSSDTVASFEVVASEAGRLDAWVDFNGNRRFDHPAEHLGAGTSLDLIAGTNSVSYTVPAGSVVGEVAARFRVSGRGGLLPTGLASTGEVEDYFVSILDGNAGAELTVTLPAGSTDAVSDGTDVVIRRAGVELFRAPAGSIRRIESLDIRGNGPNTLNLDLQTFLAAHSTDETVVVQADLEDTVDVGEGWSVIETRIEQGTFYRVLALETGTLLLNGPANWQNPVNRHDVNNNGFSIEPIGDILLLINEFNRQTIISPTGELPVSPTGPISSFLDVNGDGLLTPSGDILLQINEANRQGAGEGESITFATNAAFTDVSSPLSLPNWMPFARSMSQPASHSPTSESLVALPGLGGLPRPVPHDGDSGRNEENALRHGLTSRAVDALLSEPVDDSLDESLTSDDLLGL